MTDLDTTTRPTPASDVEKPPLPPGYDNVHRRLQVFDEHLSGEYGHILSWLLDRREELLSQGKDLPPPWVFANEQDVVELEWEVGPRFLSLRLNPDRPFEYSRVDESTAPIEEQGGGCCIG